jgi:tRNA-uridine 2-sulfurtransferase
VSGKLKVIAAMSGGVDSAVAAARAVEAGHEVIGVHLALSSNPQKYRSGARGCCTVEDSHDARRAADVIGIPFYIWDMAEQFHAGVVENFLSEYQSGRTPNPCLRCNEKIKFEAVLVRAKALGFDAVVTGHYAITKEVNGVKTLNRAVDPEKDQSYVLAVLTPIKSMGRSFHWVTQLRMMFAKRRKHVVYLLQTSQIAMTSALCHRVITLAGCASVWALRLVRSLIKVEKS